MSNAPRPDAAEASVVLLVIAASGLAIIVGLAMHVARAIVVREPLWEGRYRGPSVLALLVLAIIAANAASVSRRQRCPGGDPGPRPVDHRRPWSCSPSRRRASWPWRASSWPRRAPWRASASSRSAGSALVGVGRAAGRPGLDRCAAAGCHHRPCCWSPIGLRPDVGVAEAAIGLVDPLVLAIALIVVAPVAEEIFFRGIVYNAWLREFGVRRAIIGSAALFALIRRLDLRHPGDLRPGHCPGAALSAHGLAAGLDGDARHLQRHHPRTRPAGPLRHHPPALISAR